MNFTTYLRTVLALPVLLLAFAASSEAAVFHCISAAADCKVPGTQFSVVATSTGAGANQMGFLLKNAAGGAASGISEIYFENGWDTFFNTSLMSFGYNGVGTVAFSGPGASPGNLPGQNNAIPAFTTGSLKTDNGNNNAGGIDPGEQLIIYLTFKAGQSLTLAQTNEKMQLAGTRIGLHVRRMANGASAAYVTPEPQTYSFLAAIGCIGLFLVHRRRKVTVS